MEQYEVTIEKFSHEGRGIARVNKILVFVDGAIPQDHCVIEITKQHKKFYEAKVIEMLTPSPLRIQPVCEIFGKCGGCQFQTIPYEEELKLKVEKILDQLKRFAKIEIEPTQIIGAKETTNYRNKVKFHVKDGVCGFYHKRTNDLIKVPDCKLIDPILMEVKREIEKTYDLTRAREIMIRVGNGEVLLKVEGIITNIEGIHKALPYVTSIIQNGKILVGSGSIKQTILDQTYQVADNSFLQVNIKQTEQLYKIILDRIKEMKPKTVLDLYCGVGTIALSATPYVTSVIGMEVVREAVKSANQSKVLNNIENARFICGNVERKLNEVTETIDMVIVDPPRIGLTKSTIEEIKAKKPSSIIYVSCNPSTLARDLKEFEDKYELKSIDIVDMFPRTEHVESVSLLIQKTIEK